MRVTHFLAKRILRLPIISEMSYPEMLDLWKKQVVEARRSGNMEREIKLNAVRAWLKKAIKNERARKCPKCDLPKDFRALLCRVCRTMETNGSSRAITATSLAAMILLIAGCCPRYVPRDYRADYHRAHAHPSPELRQACIQYRHDKAYWDETQDGFDAVYNSEYNMQQVMKGN